MKSIANQYQALKEGKMSQANFMRNIRMTFPQYVTNVTSFDDSVRILKNKGMLTESHRGNDQWLEDFDNLINQVPSLYLPEPVRDTIMARLEQVQEEIQEEFELRSTDWEA